MAILSAIIVQIFGLLSCQPVTISILCLRQVTPNNLYILFRELPGHPVEWAFPGTPNKEFVTEYLNSVFAVLQVVAQVKKRNYQGITYVEKVYNDKRIDLFPFKDSMGIPLYLRRSTTYVRM